MLFALSNIKSGKVLLIPLILIFPTLPSVPRWVHPEWHDPDRSQGYGHGDTDTGAPDVHDAGTAAGVHVAAGDWREEPAAIGGGIGRHVPSRIQGEWMGCVVKV